MQSINEFIKVNNLCPGDAIELVAVNTQYPKHYALLMDSKNGNPEFIANTTEGVMIIREHKLAEFISKYKVSKIERFNGDKTQRTKIIRKAARRLGEKAYNIIFNNCEHFKNWVLYGESKSEQIKEIGSSIILTGVLAYSVGLAYNKKGLIRAGLILIVVVVALSALSLYVAKQINEANQK